MIVIKNRGKAFEHQFRNDWNNSFPDTFLLRLADQMSYYKGTSQNPCDFLAFVNNTLFLIECKCHNGNSIPFSVMPQADRLTQYSRIKGIRAGFVVWFVTHQIVVWIPIEVITKMKEDGKKSVNIKDIATYNIKILPSKMKKIYLQTDYSEII